MKATIIPIIQWRFNKNITHQTSAAELKGYTPNNYHWPFLPSSPATSILCSITQRHSNRTSRWTKRFLEPYKKLTLSPAIITMRKNNPPSLFRSDLIDIVYFPHSIITLSTTRLSEFKFSGNQICANFFIAGINQQTSLFPTTGRSIKQGNAHTLSPIREE